MKNSSNIKLELTQAERKKLRQHKVRISDVVELRPNDLQAILNTSEERAKEICALAAFQQISSIGTKFAKDLIFLGFYSPEDLKGKSGSKLLDDYEKRKGFQTDPCVEDQFWLAVDYANGVTDKNWWDYSEARKKYRIKNGYPPDRPQMKWTELTKSA